MPWWYYFIWRLTYSLMGIIIIAMLGVLIEEARIIRTTFQFVLGVHPNATEQAQPQTQDHSAALFYRSTTTGGNMEEQELL